MPPGGAVVFGRSVLSGGNEVDSSLGAEPRSAEDLVVGRPSETREQDYMVSRSVLVLSKSALTASGSLARKRLTRGQKRERSEFTITNK